MTPFETSGEDWVQTAPRGPRLHTEPMGDCWCIRVEDVTGYKVVTLAHLRQSTPSIDEDLRLSMADIKAGRTISHEELMRDLGRPFGKTIV